MDDVFTASHSDLKVFKSKKVDFKTRERPERQRHSVIEDQNVDDPGTHSTANLISFQSPNVILTDQQFNKD